ncbi:hypothetical protein BN871_AV_00110 [Paenibacillus sp. P22]|nr:hypothetical protein BN871_AV_00110 [Paenibacillus sp. P22]
MSPSRAPPLSMLPDRQSSMSLSRSAAEASDSDAGPDPFPPDWIFS